MRRTMPYIVTTKFISASFWSEPLAYVDVFSSAFAAEAETKAVAAATEMKANPMAMAWAWSDSLSWDLKLTRRDAKHRLRLFPARSRGRRTGPRPLHRVSARPA